MKINRLPCDDKTNGWSAILPQREPKPSLEGNVKFDWIVLGAGYAGLSAARRLAENQPDTMIALVEAGEAGENASGRNSGFAIDIPHNIGSSLEELDGSHAYMRLARSAVNHLQNLVEKHGIECDWSRDGKYHAAVSDKAVKEILIPHAKELEALQEPFEWLNAEELSAKIGTAHFKAAIYTPGGALMNPAALTRGLADSLPDNVKLYENSPIIEADIGNRITLKTAKGSLTGPKLILATNGFSEQFGFYKNRLLHLIAHCSLSRQLTAKERDTYAIENSWGLTPANAFVGITMRYTNDYRFVIRHGLKFRPGQRVTMAEQKSMHAHHKVLFDQRFPMLPNVDMEHMWSGVVCLSKNSAPGFGELAPNVWSAICQNALGVTKGTFGGMLAADLATGVENPLIRDMKNLGTPSLLPPRPFLDIGVRSRFAWENWVNRNEA